MLQKRFLMAFPRKWRKLRAEALAYVYFRWEEEEEEEEELAIPKDVPKGHTVVYVGEERKRFVVPLSALDHPLFRALLDRAQEAYEFNVPDAKLCIPCDEAAFLGVLSCVRQQQQRDRRRILLCF